MENQQNFLSIAPIQDVKIVMELRPDDFEAACNELSKDGYVPRGEVGITYNDQLFQQWTKNRPHQIY